MVGEILSSAEAFDFKLSDIEPIDKYGSAQDRVGVRYTLKEKG